MKKVNNKISFLNSIKVKLIVFLAIITFLPLLIYSLIILNQSNKILHNELSKSLLLETKLLSSATSNYLEERINQVRLITQADVLEGNNFFEIQQYIKEAKATSNEIIDIDVYDLNGKRLASADGDNDLKEIGKIFYEEYSIFKSLFNKTKESKQGNVIIGFNHLEDDTQEIILLSPITDAGNIKIVKILLVQLSFENIERLFKSSLEDILGLSNLIIIDSNGNIIDSVHNKSKEIETKSIHSILKNIEEFNENYHIYLDEKSFNSEKFISFSKIKFENSFLLNKHWFIIAIADKNEVFKPIQLLFSKYIKASLIISIIIILIIVYLYWIIINPLSKTIYKIDEIKAGDYQKRLSEFTSGEFRNLEIAFNSLLDKINIDFNKLKETNYTLQKSIDREKELGVLKTNFVSMASHEFRTPLASINATTDVILKYSEKLSKDDIEKRLFKIKNEVGEMTDMLEDILILGNTNSQKINFDPSEINIASVVKNIINQYQLTQLKEREVKFEFSSDKILIKADKKWVKNIIINLFSNAIKYSEPNTLINICILETSNSIILSVIDKGIGISEKDIKTLFEPFFRGQNVEQISGSGLGLTILQKAVELHKGEVKIISELNKGSEFRIILPIS